jgi:dTDP-4-amino-4,6-dideoxy-D-glucose transaminase
MMRSMSVIRRGEGRSAPVGVRVPVTRPALPPFERFMESMAVLWETRMLSNNGPSARALEQEFARYADSDGHVRCASNCDAALTLAVRALCLPAGSCALVPSLGFPSTVHALEWNGLRPHFVDVDPHDWCVHAEQLTDAPSDVSVVIATHLFGVPCDVGGLERWAQRHGAALVFDAAHAIATWTPDGHVSAFGDASAFSLSATKVAGGAEGAIAVLRDGDHAERFSRLRAYGLDDDRVSRETGLNAKLSELHAALALLTIEQLDTQVALRERLVDRYRARLRDMPGLALQQAPAGARVTPTFFAVDLGAARDRVRGALAHEGIEARPYFPALHRMDRLRDLPGAPLPVTGRLGDGLLALPLYSELAPELVDEVCDVVLDSLARSHAEDGK